MIRAGLWSPLVLATLVASFAPDVVAAVPGSVDAGVPLRLAETGGPVKVWIFLADKGLPDAATEEAAVAALPATWPARAVERRQMRRTLPGLFDARDLPVAELYLHAVQAAGAQVHVTSRWLNAVSATVDGPTLARLAALPFVTRIQLVGRSAGGHAVPSHHAPAGPVATGALGGAAESAGDGSPAFYGFSHDQLQLINLPALHALGFTGQGIVIGVLDTGFQLTHDAFNAPGHPLDVLAAFDFLDNDPNVGIEAGDDPDQHFHGTFVLGLMAAYLPGTLMGAAYDASFILCKTESAIIEEPAEEDYYVAGLEFIEQQGGDVATASLGYIEWYTQADLDGQTATTTQAVNIATANGLFCVAPAGNGGHDLDPGTSHLMAPGDAFQVITCGAVEITSEYASYTSDGPTADGRVKPEVMAMGDQAVSVWPYEDDELAWADGTSTSTPQVAGVVACLVEAGPSWSLATVRERLMQSASYLGSPVPDPAVIYGWGILDALGAYTLAGTWVPVGSGTPGVNGVPQLSGSGALIGTEPTTLALTGAKPSGSAFLVIGLSQASAPFKGGVLVPAPNLVVAGLPLNAAGALTLTAPWAPGLPGGTSLWFQCWIPDAAGPLGFSASKGLKATTP